MASDLIYQSDRKQSIGPDFVDYVERQNEERAANGEPLIEPPVAGVVCGHDKKHGRMLMSAKTGMLECGQCGYQVAPPKD